VIFKEEGRRQVRKGEDAETTARMERKRPDEVAV